MDMAVLEKEIESVSIAFYQNREQEGLEKVGALLPKLKIVTDALLEVRDEDEQQILFFISMMYQNFNRAYEQKDMLGMADCLQEYAAPIAALYRLKY